VWLIYPLGLAFLPILHFIYGWTTLVEFENLLPASWWLGIVASLLTALLVGITRFFPEISHERVAFLDSLFSMKWLYRLIWAVIRTIEGVIQFSTAILQGDGGVLWAFLMLLVLFLVFVALLGGI
jgi:hypothetical protein